jgi:uncharacterized protein (TIGR02284 family)
MDNDEVISTLNELIETCKDGEASYQTCANDAAARQSRLEAMFLDLQHGCDAAATELQGIVRAAGGQACTDSSVGSTVYRNWIHLKTAFIGDSDEAVLIDCEREEDAAKRKYRAALDLDLPHDIRVIVEHQYQGVLVNHGQIKMLRDQLKAAA